MVGLFLFFFSNNDTVFEYALPILKIKKWGNDMKNPANKQTQQVSKRGDKGTRVRPKTKKKAAANTIMIPVRPEIFLYFFKDQDFDGINNVEVSFTDDTAIISGTANKLLMTINFTFEVKPIEVIERKIIFKIINMTPVNQDWIKKAIFKKSTFLSYDQGRVIMDLNAFEPVRQFPFGTFTSCEIKNDTLWIGINL